MNYLQMLAAQMLKSRGTQAAAPPVQAPSPNLMSMALRMKGLGGLGSSMSSIGSYGAQGGIGTGIGELATGLSGFGAAAAFPMAGYATARMVLPAISKAIFGEGKKAWEYSTPELMSGNVGDPKHNPLINSVLRSRGLQLSPSTAKDLQIFNLHTQDRLHLPWDYELKDQSTLAGYNQLSDLYAQGANA